ncbi:hypothetical protein [Mucilaginibacter antarcticus]|uniref:hypothetical protein n=1 Tax=Mucilaginibacter antarcticus TaxID=1855725 RepID=UPI00363395FD
MQNKVTLGAVFFRHDGFIQAAKSGDDFNNISLKPGESAHYTFKLTAPNMKGSYETIFSIRTQPFEGSKNSRIIDLEVE